jgi:NAD(P)H-flavin reductase/hemoglobin-like flavoprotein
MSNAGSDYEQLLALRHAIQLRRSLRDDGVAPAPARPTGYPERLTDQELMVESLEAIGSAADEVVRSFYAQLFLGRPYLRGLFPASLDTRSDRLFSALLKLAEQLDRVEDLVPVLEQLGRDHRKYGVRPSHHDAVRQAMVGALREHAGTSWRPEYETAWNRAYDFAARVMMAADAGSTDPPYWQAVVVDHQRRYADIAVLRLRTDHPYPYRAGQYATVEVAAQPRLWRPYSLAGAPRPDGVLELHVRAHELGQVSTALVERTTVGDPLRLGPAMGRAVLDPAGTADLLVVAGGTGLSPCKAVIEQVLAAQPARRVHLIFGARRTAELYDLPALTELAGRYPRLTLRPVVTDDPDFGGPTEQLPDVVADGGPWEDREVYFCGPPGLVRALDRLFTRLGVPPERVHHDPVD